MERYAYGHMLQEYLVERVRAMAMSRAAARAGVRTRKEVFNLRDEVRRKLRASFGRLSERTPLNARVTGSVTRRDYTLSKVIFESRPGFPVTANLYVPPRGRGPMPAVLAACGHSQDGKACDFYQAFMQNLARQGYVGLIYDPISQGERVQYPRREGRRQPRGCCHEHNMAGDQMGLLGEFFGMWRVWDGMRALDFLLSLPEVDRRRVGVTGNSGGGTLTTYLTGLEGRFSMAAPSCFVTRYLSNLENELPADSEQIPPGIIGAGLDIADFFVAHMPRPTILLGQKNDYFDRRGLVAAYEELRRLYGILGAEGNIELFIGPQGHGYSVHNREAMYRFFKKHSGIRAGARERRGLSVEDERTLWATPRGQVHLMGVRRVFDFTAERAVDVARRRRRASEKVLRARIVRCLNLPRRSGVPHYRVMRMAAGGKKGNVPKAAFAVETEAGMQSLLHVFLCERALYHFPAGKRATVYVPHRSSTAEFAGGKTPRTLPLFAVDVRGMGEMTSMACVQRDFFDVYGTDYFHAAQGLMLNESCCGRRVHDLLRVLDLFEGEGYDSIHLAGRGMGAITAAFAACLHPVVKQVTLHNALLSYHELTQAPVYSWPLSCLPFGILRELDLPDCYRLLARKKKLKVVSPWDSQMRPWRREKLRAHLKALGLSGLRVS